MQIPLATAAEVAAALGVCYKPKGTPMNAICHVPSNPKTKSVIFRDPETPGGSLWVTCWAGCPRERARHALQNSVNMPICRCRSCYEAARCPSSRPAPTPVAPVRPVTARKPSPKPNPTLLWRAGVPVPPDTGHAARRWLADRHLWRAELEPPLTVRWLSGGCPVADEATTSE